MRPMRKLTFTTFHKTCAIFCVALLIITTGGLIQYRNGVDILYQEFMHSAKGTYDYMKDIIDMELNRLFVLQETLNQNWDINKLSLLCDEYSIYEQYEAAENIKDKLWAVQSSSRMIESLHVYIADIDKRIGTYSTSLTMEHERLLYEQINEHPKGKLYCEDNQIVLITQSAYTSKDNSDRPAFFIRATFSNSSLKDFISSYSTKSLSNIALFYPYEGILLSVDEVPQQIEKQLMSLSVEELDMNEPIRLTLNSQPYTAFCSRLSKSDLYVLQYFSNEIIAKKLNPQKNIVIGFGVFVICAGMLFSLSIYKVLHKPLQKLVYAFKSVESGDLNQRIELSGSGEFHYLYQGFNQMLIRLRDLIHLSQEQTKLAYRAEFKQLQSQIDPHFLFNSFFILNKRIRSGDTDGALQLSKLLGSYFQYVTRSGRDFVPLSEEVVHMINYCKIQEIRYKNKLTLQLELPPDEIAQFMVPRLILQPICENTMKYVVEKRNEPTVFKLLFIIDDSDSYRIVLEDNGGILEKDIISIDKSLYQTNTNEISGLSNINRRLELCYGSTSGLKVERSDLGGLKITMRLKSTHIDLEV